MGRDWTDYVPSKDSVAFMSKEQVNVIPYHKRSGATPYYGFERYLPTDAHPDLTDSRAFANRVRRYIQSLSRVKYSRDKYEGKLDQGALIKFALPPIDGGDYNKRVFFDKKIGKSLDTAIIVLVDWSGSMRRGKMVHAADAGIRLVHVFDRILRVPVQLATFSNGASMCSSPVLRSAK